MSYDEILADLKSKLTDDIKENDRMLRKEAERFAKEKNSDGVKAAGDLLLENMPEEELEEIKRITHVDGMRLDVMHNKIVEFINKHSAIEAKPLAERLYKKITVEFKEGEKAKFVSTRNPFEDNLLQILFKQDKVLNRAPFDLATYLTTYAYILTETGSPLDAIPVLRKAIEFNPVDCGPMFELAEVYKLLSNRKRLFEITRDTIKVASSPVALARCYANIGYILTDSQDYDDAAAFYTASVMMYPHKMIPYEMRNLAQMKGTPLKQFSHEQIIDIFKKYEIEFGPNPEVIKVASQLAAYYLGERDIPNALNALKITYNLTRDEKVKNIILKYEPDAEKHPLRDDDEQPNITQTVNNNPQK
ncbi:MAG: tetratricopeptide repeat protein [Ruminococcus flavefaciens]|nr:tetratricopeptide repeat protein [Ruminococcus flavefaciens]